MRFFDKKYLTRFSGYFNFVTAKGENPIVSRQSSLNMLIVNSGRKHRYNIYRAKPETRRSHQGNQW